MRKVKALQVLVAAITVVPCTVFAAGEETAPARPRPIDRPISPGRTFGTLPGAGRFTLAPPALHLSGGPEDNGSFTWIGPDNGTWQQASNWTPTGVPDGLGANAFITALNGGSDPTTGADVQITGTITLNSLNFSDPQGAAVHGPASGSVATINLAGGVINVSDFASERFPATGKFFGNAIGLPAQAPNPARPVILAGTSGLTLNGPGNGKVGGVAIRSINTYAGNTTLNANARLTVLPGSSLDGALGASGSLVLNGGEFWAQIDNGTLNRGVVVNPGGGTLTLGANTNSTVHTFNGVVSGAGPLVIDNTFGGDGNFTANNTFTGALRLTGSGSNTLAGIGAFAAAGSIRNAGTLVLAGAGANRLPDAGALQLNGGALRIDNGGGAYAETVGSTNLLTATPAIVIRPGGGAVYNGGTLNRVPGTGLEVRGKNLGNLPGNDVANVNFTNAAGLAINNVIPWAYGSNEDPFVTGVENAETEFMNVGPSGLRPLSSLVGGYLENTFAGANATTNVRLRAGVNGQAGNNPNYTVPGSISINSLTLAPGFDGGGNGVGGIVLNGAPGTTITVTSGGVLSSSSGFNGLALNATVGNTINVDLAFGAAEAVLNAPGAITMNGNITGTGGLTKTGLRTLFMNGTGSTYTGTTTLTGFNRHQGNLFAGQPGAYGVSTSDILLVPFDRLQNDPGLPEVQQGFPFVSFGPDVGAGSTTMTRGVRVVAGGNGELLGALFRNLAGATFNMNGPVTLDAGADATFQALTGGEDVFDVGGTIAGGGQVGTAVSAGSLTLVLRGNNTFSGGFTAAGGNIRAENNAAFGTGPIIVTLAAPPTPAVANSFSSSAPRTIANDMLFSAGTLAITGASPFTFTGNVALGGAVLDVVASNTATFSGALSEGGLFKVGAGTAVLSGNNAFHGTLSAGFDDGNGNIVNGGWIILQSNNAAGSSVGQTQAIGASAIGLRGGVSIPAEPLVIGSPSNGPDGAGALRSLSGNNTWGGRVIIVDLGAAPGGPGAGSVGAAPGAILNIGGSVSGAGAGTASTLTFTKFGPGQVNVGADAFTASRSNGATSSFQGAIVNVNHLVVNEGRLAMSPSGAEGRHVSDVGSITINGAAQFDLTNNALVVDYPAGGPSPLADVRAKVFSGYAGGAWKGPGIISSDANTTTHGVGYAEADEVLTFAGSPPDALFLGDVVDQSAVLVRYTRYGDADLSGAVNLQDFNRLAANFGATGARWDQGDFDYDGTVTLQDFNRLAANFGQLAAGSVVTPQDWANLAAAIPEPSCLAVAGLGVSALLGRRRRQIR